MRQTLALMGLCISTVALADVRVENPWIRLLPPGVHATSGYMTLTSDRHDRLLSVSTPIAHMVEIHRSSMENGMMQMDQVSGLELKESVRVELAPGGYHLMLMGLNQPLSSEKKVSLTLTFEHAEPLTVEAQVK